MAVERQSHSPRHLKEAVGRLAGRVASVFNRGARRSQAETEAAPGKIQVAVNAHVGNPLFDMLPDLLQKASPEVGVEVVFIVGDDIKTDEPTKEALRGIWEQVQDRNRRESGIFVDKEVERIELELREQSDTDNLAVLIRDPRGEAYWFRKVQVVEVGTMTVGEKEQVPYVDIKQFPMGEIENHPFPGAQLEDALNWISDGERQLRETQDPVLRAMRGFIGVASYIGKERLSLDALLNLTAVKFARMRAVS